MLVKKQSEIEQRLGVPLNAIAAFCQRWNIVEFAVFGSILRDDFRPDSDIDVLVEFNTEFKRGLIETIQMKEELQEIVNRRVDFIVKKALKRSENWLRREKILASAKIIYAKR